MRNLLFGLFVIQILASCSHDRIVYEEIFELEYEEWSYDDTLTFSFEIDDTSQVYRLLLYIDYRTDYRWQNLYTSVTTTMPGASPSSDVVSLELADKTGTWYGDCNREICQLNIPLQEQVKFPTTGTYQLSFEQYMREENLEGIREIGLKVVEPR